MTRRVVITGMGVISPIGNDTETFWESLKNGVNGINYITKFDTTNMKAKVAAEVKDFDLTNHGIDLKESKRLDLFSIYALAAANEAIADAKLDNINIDPYRVGVIVSSGIGGLNTLQKNISNFALKGPNRIEPYFIPMAIANMASGNIAIRANAKGVNMSIVTACASATHAIGEAFRKIKYNEADVIISGGSEASINEVGIAGFSALQALTFSDDINRASIPFDKERNGFVMGEGSGIIVLEEYEHAKERNATIYGEIVGYAATCDAYHITAPNSEGAAMAMQLAIKDANINLTDIDYINAHGTSTPLNDKNETLAIKNAFGDYSANLYVSSTKSMTGHLLGAAGAIEAIACIKSLQTGIIPPTINYQVVDEDCNLNYVVNKSIKKDINYAMSNSLGFGGHNGTLIFKKVN